MRRCLHLLDLRVNVVQNKTEGMAECLETVKVGTCL